MRKFLLLFFLIPLLGGTPLQDPVIREKDKIYVEFITDCNWLVYGLQGKIKLHPQHNNKVGFRTWQPYLSYGTLDLQGFVMWRNLGLWTRDYLISNWSSYKAEFGTPPGVPNVPWAWHYVIHFNELSGMGTPNAGTHMRIWGPCVIIRLYHGEAMIAWGDETFYVKVDENDYANYPPWQISLR